MSPPKSVLVVVSLVSALLHTRFARALVVIVLALAAGLALWIVTEDHVATGIVIETLPGRNGTPDFATIKTMSVEQALLLPQIIGLPPQVGDVVIASGAPRDIAGAGAFLQVDTLTVLPLATLRTQAATQLAALPVADVHPAGPIAAALLLVLFAAAALRLTFAAAMAGVTAVTAFVLWHLNTGTVVVPVPPDLLEPVLLGAGLLGVVAGWKAMSRSGGFPAQALGQRAAALLLVVPVSLAVGPVVALPPAALAFGLMAAALLRPTLVPAVLALPLLAFAQDIPREGLFAAALAIVAFRLWQDRRQSPMPGQPHGAAAQPFMPRPDARGSFDLTQILDPQKEA